MFLRPRLCLRLPSDSTSQWTPLSLASGSHYQAHNGLSPSSCCPCWAHTKKVFIPKDQGTKTYNFRGTTLIMYKTYTSLKVKISSKIASICQIRSFHQPLPLLIFKSYLLILFIAFCYLFMTKLYFIYSFLSINSSF